jgi:hypothetical protein
LAPKSDSVVGAIGYGLAAEAVATTAGEVAATVAPATEADAVAATEADAVAVAAAAGWVLVLKIERKSAEPDGLSVVAEASVLCRAAGGVYVGRVAVLNVGMT